MSKVTVGYVSMRCKAFFLVQSVIISPCSSLYWEIIHDFRVRPDLYRPRGFPWFRPTRWFRIGTWHSNSEVDYSFFCASEPMALVIFKINNHIDWTISEFNHCEQSQLRWAVFLFMKPFPHGVVHFLLSMNWFKLNSYYSFFLISS